jgi:hypothetical protein
MSRQTYYQANSNMVSFYLPAAALLLGVVLLRTLLRRLRAHSIRHLPGPPPGPWLVGMPPANCFPSRPTLIQYRGQEIYQKLCTQRRRLSMTLHGRESMAM